MFLKSDTSQANEHFARIPNINKPRNAFGIAERHLTTIQFDKLYPIFHKFIMPGDTISITHALIARLTTQISVLHDDLYFDMHAWYVPLRLVQTNFNRLYWGTQDTPGQVNTSLTTPSLPSGIDGTGVGGLASKSLYDFFGYPTKVRNTAGTHYVNNYLGRAYNLIWNENYRDENLQTKLVVDLDDGEDAIADYNIVKRGRRYDKFSSVLGNYQKNSGAASDIFIPIGGQASVLRRSSAPAWNVYVDASDTNPTASALSTVVVGGDTLVQNAGAQKLSFDPRQGSNQSGLYASFTDSYSSAYFLVKDLRRSVAIQQILESDNRSGTRPNEASMARFGTSPSDSTLQRPEYLGGMTFTFDGKIVPQTSMTSGTHYQGDLTQFSQAQNQFNVTHSFNEWGVMMILISARANITYQQGLARELSWRTRWDFYQPEMANTGDVAMLQQEIYYSGVVADYTTVFGYQEYGYEMRYGENRVSGEFRSNFTGSRDYKHCAENYASAPTYSATWIQSNTRIDTNLAVATATADPIEINALTKGKIARVMPLYSVPGMTRI